MAMSADAIDRNARMIADEIAWLQRVIERRFHAHASKSGEADLLGSLPPPALPADAPPYGEAAASLGMGAAERLILILAYAPVIRPEALDPFLIQNQSVQRRFTEFGGDASPTHGGFLPTVQTALFLLAGDDMAARLRAQEAFSYEHPLRSHGVLMPDSRPPGEPPHSAPLRLTPEFIERLSTGKPYHPPHSAEFPAQRITTPYAWSDLVLDEAVLQDVEDIASWIRHGATLMEDWELKRRIKPGFRSLFYGPPGTGKSLTAALIGKHVGRDVYRVDLSLVVSKYIGETEKNFARLFDSAQHRDWILFFDEADALFGKRTATSSAHDRFANQEVAYLLQRIEDFPGVAILASNLDGNIDEAFSRRFQSKIHFRLPDAEQRLKLWKAHFSGARYRLARDADLDRLAREYELSGGGIVNVLRYACLQAVTRKPQIIQMQDLLDGMRRELHKEGRFAHG